MRIADASFVVVDTETTGRRAADNRVIEIGAVLVRGGKIVERFEELINPECAVPRRITQLTGISTAMLFDRPTARDVLPHFTAFLGEGVFAAHNLSFDVGFLRHESLRAGLPEFPNETLCTLRLARRLLPGLRSKGLAVLADFYGIRNRRHHRALADAEATAEVLLRFIDHVDLEFGIDRLAELLSFQYRRYSELRETSSHVTRIRTDVLDGLPNAPGVYFMKNGRGKVLYVGKAQDLSARVRSYFSSIEGHPPRIRKMIKAVRDVSWEEADSELDALMLESRLIKELQPTYNRAQRRYVNRPFIRVDTRHAFPRVSFSAFLHDDGAEYYGPLSDRHEAAFLVDLIDRFFRLRECDDELFARGRRCVYASLGRCNAPCEDHTRAGEYESELDRVRTFLAGADDSVCARIEEAMRAAAGELDYEQAAIYRDWLERLRRILGKREAVATRVLDHNAVVIHQASERPIRLLLIRRGRHVDTLRADGDLEDTLRRLKRTLAGHVDSTPSTDVYREQEIDEIYMLSHWLYVHRKETRHVRWRDGEPIAQFVGRLASFLTPADTSDAPGRSPADHPPTIASAVSPGTLGDGAVLTDGRIPRQT